MAGNPYPFNPAFPADFQIVDGFGLLTPAWQYFFRGLWLKSGGAATSVGGSYVISDVGGVPVLVGSGPHNGYVIGNVTEAPLDGNVYGRKNAGWVDVFPVSYPELPPEVQQVPIAFPFGGMPPAGAVVNIPMAMSVMVPEGLAGTVVYDGIRATANANFTVNRITPITTYWLGTIIITPGGHTTCLIDGVGGTLNIGDTLQVVAPSPQDATLANVGLTIMTMRV